MDYVVGSVAALVTGNVTPNRPRVLNRALTPTKHQPSPNVTPKSEFVDDRSIFLSPTLQKKKAIVKKSPKRIFQNPDLDITNEGDATSEKAEKVKKHLKEELDCEKMVINLEKHKDVIGVQNKPIVCMSPKKKKKHLHEDEITIKNTQITNENTPKKKKKQKGSLSNSSGTVKENHEISFIATNMKIKVESTEKLKKQKNLFLDTMGHKNEEQFLFKTEIVSNNVQTTPKKNKKKRNSISVSETAKEDRIKNFTGIDMKTESEGTPKKKKKQNNLISETFNPEEEENFNLKTDESVTESVQSTPKKKKNKKKNKKTKSSPQTVDVPQNTQKSLDDQDGSQSLNRKRKLSDTVNQEPNKNKIWEAKSYLASEMTNNKSKSKKKNKQKKKSKKIQNVETNKPLEIKNHELTDDIKSKQKKSNKNIVNPNAITSKDTDSEHESDNEIESENEETNNEILKNDSFEESSDDEDKEEEKTKNKTLKKKEVAKKTERTEVNTEEELKRTLFVGNVVYTPKCKKQIKKIFMHYGPIETIRLRAIPIKDARFTPKLAVIKNELHPERSTINVYIKYKEADSVDKALAENNTLYQDKHLRVTRSDSTGELHPPKASVFVGNLPFGLEDEGLREKFEKCGEIESVRIIRDRNTNIGKGFGYVNFTSKDAVELALALTDEDLTIKNRILRVKRCSHTVKSHDNTSNDQSFSNQRDFNSTGRSFNNRGGRGGRTGFNDRGGERDFNHRGGRGGRNFSSRGGQNFSSRGGQNFSSRGGQNFSSRGGQNFSSRGGQNFSSRGSFNNRGQDDQNQGFQGRIDKNDIGACRRIMNKRQHQEGGNDGPPQKRPKNINQPGKEKKPRKEFVGMTAEKKKKRKNSKSQGLRQKIALSEILSK